jgi:uncharacterized membrane protein
MQDVDSNDRLLVALTYIFTPLVPIVLMIMEDKKDRPFIKAHNAQALVIGLIQVVLWVTSFACIPGLIALALLVAQFYWAYKAYQGEEIVIPVITDFVKKQGWA